MEENRGRVLFIDDDPTAVEPYRLELELAGFAVEHCAGPDDARRCLARAELARQREVPAESLGDPPYACVVLDIMMAHGDSFTSEETNSGFDTGLRLFDWLRDEWPELPVVVLTNRFDRQITDHFEGQPRCRWLLKPEPMLTDLLAAVEGLVPERKRDPREAP